MGIIKKSFNLIAFLLVFLVTASVVNGADAGIDENTIYEIKNLSKYTRSIEEMKLLIQSMQNAVDKEKKSLAEYESKKYIDEIAEISSQIEQIKFYNGFTDVRGPGIMLRVSDNVSEDTDLGIMERIVHDVDIVVLLNDLKAAGAEAIEINGKRITNLSEVVCAGPLIRVNNEVIPAPFVIVAIGDMDKLYEAVTEEGTYAYELKNTYGMEVVAVKGYNLTVRRFRGIKYKNKYAQIIQEEVN
ncbi:MAG TPA: DUF881 domain-containing protein [Sedimentibacter sp.]|nr:DUF881 domain-containing protein [Sedimentibacter sp.]HOW23706.1 DUF881 domain-containing protein [Sedimentibacter sp.]HRC80589.1 DUF881 domain-containing protein [Sedimentibacter sp.]